MSPCDSIIANDTILDAFQRSRDYDYVRELVPDHQENYFDRFWSSIEDFFGHQTDNAIQAIPDWGWWCLGTLVVMVLCYFIWNYRVIIFGPRDTEIAEQEITVDDINEVDFDQLIAEAEKNGDHLMLCRLRYLQTLKAASDASLVTWCRYKTPTQYAMEWHDADFTIMTNHFLRIRYGHYAADAALAEEMRSRQAVLLARISTSVDKEPSHQQQEGGEPS